MDVTITPGKLNGRIHAIPSKSQTHRLLICAAFADRPTQIHCTMSNADTTATIKCLLALGAKFRHNQDGWLVSPITALPEKAVLPCGESGSTLRFLLPIVGSLGVDATLLLEGRLPQRPLSPLWEEMERMGCNLSRPTPNTISCTGQLRAGDYTVAGNISSQFITGLLFAMALMDGQSTLTVTGKLESKPYVDLSCQALAAFGIHTENFVVNGNRKFRSPGNITVEGDWSNAAFFLAAHKLGSSLAVDGLSAISSQGDRAVVKALDALDSNCVIDAADIPDLVPVLAVTAGALNGAVFTNIARLRLKESDRVAAVAAMLEALGATVEVLENTMTVFSAAYHGCIIDSHADHRIAMAAAIAATIASGPVTILGAECVTKSYPNFWEDYHKLGGCYEQYIR